MSENRVRLLKKNFPTLTALALLFALSGCTGFGKDTYAPVIVSGPRASLSVIGYSTEKRPMEIVILGTGPKTVFVLATIHGNESAGTPLLEKLTGSVLTHPSILAEQTIILLPVANPDGYARNSRFNARGVDLNRNFPTPNRINSPVFGLLPLSEPETAAIAGIIHQYRPGRIISIHQPLACIDYDGLAQTIAECMADVSHLPIKKLGARPGSLGSYAGEVFGIAIITLELTSDDSLLGPDQLWERYGPALLAGITCPAAF